MAIATRQTRDNLFYGPGLVASGFKFRNHTKWTHAVRLTRIFRSLQQKIQIVPCMPQDLPDCPIDLI
jgi:hypothetical protein